MATKIIRLITVMAITGLSRSAIYAKMADGTFPKSVRISDRGVGWVEGEIHQYNDMIVAVSRGTTPANPKEKNHG